MRSASANALLLSALALCLLVPAHGQGARFGEAQKGLLIGVLQKQGIRSCDKKGKVTWLKQHHEVGFVWLLGKTAAANKLAGKLVVVEGKTANRPQVTYPPQQTCPIMQSRSDWQPGLNGIRRRRSTSNPIAAFKARSIRAFDGLSIKRKKKQLVVTLKNTLGRNIESLTLSMHYEGCYGKPGTMRVERKIKALAKKKSARLTFPIFSENPRRHRGHRRHIASSLAISSKAVGLYFDFDWPLYRDKSFNLRCPRN